VQQRLRRRNVLLVRLESLTYANLADGAAIFCSVVGRFFGGRLGRIVDSRSLSQRRRDTEKEVESYGSRGCRPSGYRGGAAAGGVLCWRAQLHDKIELTKPLAAALSEWAGQ
jgi:hypothetical protein